MAEQRPLLLRLYRGLARLAAPLFSLLFWLRSRSGKELVARKGERFGKPVSTRPEGKLVWIHVAELGVVLLLFVIGLELDPSKLWRMKRDIFGLGTAQVVLTGICLFAIGRLVGLPYPTAFVAGFGLALSSTAFALQILQERGQLSSPYGQRAFGILLLQDIAIVPLLAMVAILAPGEGPSTATEIASEVLIVLGAVAAVVLTGRYLISPIFLFLAASRAREVMLTAALLVALGSAGIMDRAL